MEEKDLEFLNSFTEKLEKTVVDLCSADELLDGKMLEVEENMARALTINWKEYDLAKAVTY